VFPKELQCARLWINLRADYLVKLTYPIELIRNVAREVKCTATSRSKLNKKRLQ
jgi:hypothetical protein